MACDKVRCIDCAVKDKKEDICGLTKRPVTVMSLRKCKLFARLRIPTDLKSQG